MMIMIGIMLLVSNIGECIIIGNDCVVKLVELICYRYVRIFN